MSDDKKKKSGFVPDAPTGFVPDAPVPPKTGIIESAARGFQEGASLGFSGELGGVGAKLGDWLSSRIHNLPSNPNAYVEGRDEVDAANAKAAADRPYAYHPAQIAGAVFNPASRVLPGGGGIAGAGLRAGIEGAAFSAGSSTADLTKGEGGQFVKDVSGGALLGGAMGTGGAALGKGVKALADKKASTLPDRILAEIAEGSSGLRTTPTAAKKLARGVNNIVDEVVHGPDAKAVRAAYLGRAADGVKGLKPIVDKVGGNLDEAYEKFQAAGVAQVDSAAHLASLRGAAQQAAKQGKSLVSDGLKSMADQFEGMVTTAGGPIDLRALRQFTTEAQQRAAQAIGGLNQGTVKTLRDALAAEQTKLMAGTLASKATTPELTAALKIIQENNPRMNALLNIRSALELRAAKEQTTDLVLKATKGVAAGGGLAAGVAQGDDAEDKLKQGIFGFAAGTLLPMAAGRAFRGVQRGITSMGIQAQRAGASGTAAASRVKDIDLDDAVESIKSFDLKRRGVDLRSDPSISRADLNLDEIRKINPKEIPALLADDQFITPVSRHARTGSNLPPGWLRSVPPEGRADAIKDAYGSSVASWRKVFNPSSPHGPSVAFDGALRDGNHRAAVKYALGEPLDVAHYSRSPTSTARGVVTGKNAERIGRAVSSLAAGGTRQPQDSPQNKVANDLRKRDAR